MAWSCRHVRVAGRVRPKIGWRAIWLKNGRWDWQCSHLDNAQAAGDAATLDVEDGLAVLELRQQLGHALSAVAIPCRNVDLVFTQCFLKCCGIGECTQSHCLLGADDGFHRSSATHRCVTFSRLRHAPCAAHARSRARTAPEAFFWQITVRITVLADYREASWNGDSQATCPIINCIVLNVLVPQKSRERNDGPPVSWGRLRSE